MKRHLRVLAFALAMLSAAAPAAEEKHLGTPQQQRACRPDVLKHCRAVQGGDVAIAKCLEVNTDKLTPACRKVIEGEK
jgi:hypothetical protein